MKLVEKLANCEFPDNDGEEVMKEMDCDNEDDGETVLKAMDCDNEDDDEEVENVKKTIPCWMFASGEILKITI